MPLIPQTPERFKTRVLVLLVVISLLATVPLSDVRTIAQNPTTPATRANELFRLERTPVDGGAELITIHGKLDGIATSETDNWVPLVTVLRDTLGDFSTENDRLRYVWPLTYTRPTLRQRLSGAVPFFYSRVGNKKKIQCQSAASCSGSGCRRSRRVEQDFLDRAAKSSARSIRYSVKGVQPFIPAKHFGLPEVARYSRTLGVNALSSGPG